MVITEPVASIQNDKGESIDIRVKQRFNLQKRINKSDGKIMWVVSRNPKGKLWKLCRKCGVEYPSDLKGKYITLVLEPSSDPNDDRMFLRISV